MAANPVSVYPCASSGLAGEALRSLGAKFQLRRDGRTATDRQYFDTFDWRLFRCGACLSVTTVEGQCLVRWDGLDGHRQRRVTVPEPPQFAGELPPGRFRDELARVIGIRRLLPIVCVDRRTEEWSVVDGRGKIVTRVHLDRGSANLNGSRPRRMPVRLQVERLNGYERVYGRVQRVLERDVGLAAHLGGELTLGLSAMGRRPVSYTGKIDITLAIDERADRAVKRILTELFGIMQANEDGMRRNLDSEFLHDFRVAIRRTRSCIGEMKGVFAESVVTQFAKEFAWLGALTGPTRDLDVYLLNFGEYEASLPAVSRSDLAPLAPHLRRRRDEAQQLQNQGLDSDRYRRLKRKWSARLKTGTDESAPNAARPIVAVAAERIGHAYARVQKHGRRIGDGTSAAAIHRVRIDCKKLRYLLEFFGSVFDPSRVATVTRSLKRLQADLGDYNDLQVQQEELKRMADELGRDGAAEARTLLAMGRLVEGLASRQLRLRRRVAKGVKTFTDDRTSAEVAALLR